MKRAAPYGTEVGITFDWNGPHAHHPRAGDAIEAKTRFYLVTSVRKVNSKTHPSRWRIRAVVAEDTAGADRVIPLVWSRR